MIGTSQPVVPAHGPHILAMRVEHIPVTVYTSSAQASKAVAQEIAALIDLKAARGEKTVLGLATGSTPTGVYDELVRLHREEKLSFKNVITFNLDEYWPVNPDDLQSYRRFMNEHLFDHIDIQPKNAHVPDGTVPLEQVGQFCQEYERQIREAGGLDYQILGIGRTGHIGFNEPGSPRDSRTRIITLDRVTRMDAASDFFGEWNVPRKAITMGVETILAARTVVLLAFGEHKAGPIRRAVEGDIRDRGCQLSPAASVGADGHRHGGGFGIDALQDAVASWSARSIWHDLGHQDHPHGRDLARHVAQKPLLKLTDEDYNEHGLQELLSHRGSAYDINIEVFKALQNTITGWPGGKPAHPIRLVRNPTYVNPWITRHPETPGPAPSDEAGTGKAIYPKRVVIFSPHPDDDVISMGGTFIRLCEQDHDVHVAYQTSGNIAVWDDTAVRHADFVAEFSRAFNLGPERADAIEKHVIDFIRNKKPGQVDSPELQQIKGLIRRSEARAGARYSGVKQENIHFLDMPFYETGRVRKKPLSDQDVQIIVDLLEKVQPHQVYAAGDLSDPHGTHRVCLAAIVQALRKLKTRDWMANCEVWLYRGAWQEWGVHEIEMAVPLSPDEVLRKRIAIFKHESQKDKALFPGPNDPREFWQRAEDRNRNTAEVYDKLGLAEYEAIEGFVRWKDDAL